MEGILFTMMIKASALVRLCFFKKCLKSIPNPSHCPLSTNWKDFVPFLTTPSYHQVFTNQEKCKLDSETFLSGLRRPFLVWDGSEPMTNTMRGFASNGWSAKLESITVLSKKVNLLSWRWKYTDPWLEPVNTGTL